MKLKVVAVAFASCVSFAAYSAEVNNTQPATQATTNGQSQTTIPSDKTRQQNNTETQVKDHADPWTLLNQGWKQFEPTGK
jgi:hypothetical protein